MLKKGIDKGFWRKAGVKMHKKIRKNAARLHNDSVDEADLSTPHRDNSPLKNGQNRVIH